ncbi:MAG: hypothetical protein EPN48_13065 [Microbacteriaceae bacterium]|nr:MAG: hypothetical protein EPN48_13065 [Microbacteriaceae bacterium]
MPNEIVESRPRCGVSIRLLAALAGYSTNGMMQFDDCEKTLEVRSCGRHQALVEVVDRRWHDEHQ